MPISVSLLNINYAPKKHNVAVSILYSDTLEYYFSLKYLLNLKSFLNCSYNNLLLLKMFYSSFISLFFFFLIVFIFILICFFFFHHFCYCYCSCLCIYCCNCCCCRFFHDCSAVNLFFI